MSDRDGFRDAFNRQVSVALLPVEQGLSLIKTEFLQHDEKHRTAFREWVNTLAPMTQAKIPFQFLASLKVRFLASDFVGDGLPGETIVDLNPAAVARAIDAWERGEDYIATAKDL